MLNIFQKILPLYCLLTLQTLGQTYKGVGDAKSGRYKCFLKILPDSTVFYNYFDDRGNISFADYKGVIKKTNDSVYQIKCEMIFGQFIMMNLYQGKLTMILDSGAQHAHSIGKIKLQFPNGQDTTIKLKFINNPIYRKAWGVSVHDIFKNRKDDYVLVDVGYRDAIFKKKILFKATENSALTFAGPITDTLNIVFHGNIIKTIGQTILQTGHLTLKKM